jgi:NAD(P)H-dependent flavin oxidoreductase YrpB (nitropropane dioxygenase family)
MKLMENKAILPFPAQNMMTSIVRKLASDRGEGEYQSMWAGSAFEKIRGLPAAKLMEDLGCELDLFKSKTKT